MVLLPPIRAAGWTKSLFIYPANVWTLLLHAVRAFLPHLIRVRILLLQVIPARIVLVLTLIIFKLPTQIRHLVYYVSVIL